MNQTIKAAKWRCSRFSGKRCYTYENPGLLRPSAMRAGVSLVGEK